MDLFVLKCFVTLDRSCSSLENSNPAQGRYPIPWREPKIQT